MTGNFSQELGNKYFSSFNPWLTITKAKAQDEHRNNLLVIRKIRRCKMCTFDYYFNTGILVSNPTGGVHECIFLSFWFSYVGWCLATGQSPFQGALQTTYIKDLEIREALRSYATSRKVACSISDEVAGIFIWPNPSSRIIVLGSTQPLTEMSARNLPGDERRPVRKVDNLIAIYEPTI
jgi:hypothetical protein